jgi:hypothetical protein
MYPDQKMQTPRGDPPRALALGRPKAYRAICDERGAILPHPGHIHPQPDADSGQAHGRMTNRRGAR